MFTKNYIVIAMHARGTPVIPKQTALLAALLSHQLLEVFEKTDFVFFACLKQVKN